MKKIIAIPIMVLAFILGVVVSEWIIQGFNALLDAGIPSRAGLREQLNRQEKELTEMNEKMDNTRQQYDSMKGQLMKKEANLNSLIHEMEQGINAEAIQDIILSTPYSETGEQGRIFLGGGGSESILELTTDDPTVNKFKEIFNNKAKDIIDVSKGILKEKIGKLDQEVVRVNSKLQDRNLQLIHKLNEEKKYKKKIDNLNTGLKNANDELTQKNAQLSQKLKEVDQYKKELEQHKKYINDLEGVKSDLQKTVGVLETKIENGRLKVSFEGDILFESGKHYLKPEGEELLKKVYPILDKNIRQNDIFIAGHTDNVPIRSDARDRYESNWTLSTYRAIEVVKYLTAEGIPPQSVTAAGYGEYKPVADNTTDAGKAKNRRVELFLIPKIIKR